MQSCGVLDISFMKEFAGVDSAPCRPLRGYSVFALTDGLIESAPHPTPDTALGCQLFWECCAVPLFFSVFPGTLLGEFAPRDATWTPY